MFERFIPSRALIEYKKRWKSLEKESFYEYLELIEKDECLTKWFTGVSDMKNSYQDYLDGELHNRLPKGLKYSPDNVLNKVIEEVDNMITFK